MGNRKNKEGMSGEGEPAEIVGIMGYSYREISSYAMMNGFQLGSFSMVFDLESASRSYDQVHLAPNAEMHVLFEEMYDLIKESGAEIVDSRVDALSA